MPNVLDAACLKNVGKQKTKAAIGEGMKLEFEKSQKSQALRN